MNQAGITLLVTLLLFVSPTLAQQKGTTVPTGNVERGRYITHSVAMCVQCHTPRDARGQLVLDRAFEGAPIPVGKPQQWNVWAEFAPRIAGLPQYSEQQLVTLLTTGIGREGKPLRAPMPTFRMTRQDALGVAEYLKSLR